MPENPFEPPPPSETDAPPPRGAPVGSPLRAILVGLVIDLGGSIVLNLLLLILYAASLQHAGMSREELKASMEHIPSDSWAAVLGLLLGACIDVFSGFVCARIARRDEWRVGGALAGLAGLSTLMLGDAKASPGDLTLLFTASTAACALLGVKYGREMNRRAEAGGD